jgi:hypothetical protein
MPFFHSAVYSLAGVVVGTDPADVGVDDVVVHADVGNA